MAFTTTPQMTQIKSISSIHINKNKNKVDLSQKQSPFILGMASSKRSRTITVEKEDWEEEQSSTRTTIEEKSSNNNNNNNNNNIEDESNVLGMVAFAATSTALSLSVLSEAADAAITMPKELSNSFDPSTFVPVCAASDSFYRFLTGDGTNSSWERKFY